MNRYLEVDSSVMDVFYKVLNERFPAYGNIKFKLMFDTKKRMRKGKLVLASTELTNEKIRHFTATEDLPEGYDYLIILDEVAWVHASDADRERIISHELNHVFIDEKGNYKLIDHDVEDFLVEIKRNEDNPDWAYDLAALTKSIYEQKEDMD